MAIMVLSVPINCRHWESTVSWKGHKVKQCMKRAVGNLMSTKVHDTTLAYPIETMAEIFLSQTPSLRLQEHYTLPNSNPT